MLAHRAAGRNVCSAGPWLRCWTSAILTAEPYLTAGSRKVSPGKEWIMPAVYPLVVARGTPRELGRQHGEQCRGRIRAFLGYLSHTLKRPPEQVRAGALRFLPLFERHCPHLVEEVRGLAEGAGVGLADALAAQVRGELTQVQNEGCTTFVIAGRRTASGQPLIGQNSDVEPEREEFAYVRRL